MKSTAGYLSALDLTCKIVFASSETITEEAKTISEEAKMLFISSKTISEEAKMNFTSSAMMSEEANIVFASSKTIIEEAKTIWEEAKRPFASSQIITERTESRVASLKIPMAAFKILAAGSARPVAGWQQPGRKGEGAIFAALLPSAASTPAPLPRRRLCAAAPADCQTGAGGKPAA